ncbi:MAG: PIN domain-containing protein [Eubacteriales bacterium]
MKILIDTNVILDIFLKREPFFLQSYEAIKKAAVNDIECLFSATAATDVFYLLRKGLQDVDKAKECMERLLQLVIIADVLALDIQNALSDSIPDFEDAVVHAVAARNNVDYILTRNTVDSEGSLIPAITPQQFISI